MYNSILHKNVPLINETPTKVKTTTNLPIQKRKKIQKLFLIIDDE